MITGLATDERAAVVAAVLAAGARAPEVLARLAAPSGARCAAAARALLEMEREARAAELARQAAQLCAPVPAGIARVHATWLEAAVDGELDAVRAVLGGASAAAPEVAAWLRRRAFGGLVDMPEAQPLCDVAPDRLQGGIETIGREWLALALSVAPAAAQAAVAAKLGKLHGPRLIEDLRKPAARPEASAAVRELGDLVAGGGVHVLLRAGARRLAPELVGQGDLARQLAQRLPRAVGLVLLDEVARARPATGTVLAALAERVGSDRR